MPVPGPDGAIVADPPAIEAASTEIARTQGAVQAAHHTVGSLPASASAFGEIAVAAAARMQRAWIGELDVLAASTSALVNAVRAAAVDYRGTDTRILASSVHVPTPTAGTVFWAQES